MDEVVDQPTDVPDNCCQPAVDQARLRVTADEVNLFKALSDSTRLGILRLLAASDEPVCVCDIVRCFPLNQPTISHHLRLLREAGLVSVSRRGTWAYYALRPSGVDEARTLLASLLPQAVSVERSLFPTVSTHVGVKGPEI